MAWAKHAAATYRSQVHVPIRERLTARLSSPNPGLTGAARVTMFGVNDPFELQRFVDAQDAGEAYARAVSELRDGRKLSHWMWFVFPQIAGLGRSPTAQRFAISGTPEAMAYRAHPILGPRLVECARILTHLPGTDAVTVLGPVDAQKLRSSMTLFTRTAPEEPVFQEVLDQYFDGESDAATTSRL